MSSIDNFDFISKVSSDECYEPIEFTVEYDLEDKARGTLKHYSKKIDMRQYFVFYYAYVYKPWYVPLVLEERPTAWYKPFNFEPMNKVFAEDLNAMMDAESYELNKDYYMQTPD